MTVHLRTRRLQKDTNVQQETAADVSDLHLSTEDETVQQDIGRPEDGELGRRGAAGVRGHPRKAIQFSV